MLRSALEAQQAERFEEARILYKEILAVQPNHPEVRHLYGMLLCETGEIVPGLAEIAAAIESNPQKPLYRLNQAHAFLLAGQTTAASRSCAAALTLAPHWLAAARLYVKILVMQDLWDEAHAVVQVMQKQHPDSIELVCDLCEVYAKRQNWKGMIDFLEPFLLWHRADSKPDSMAVLWRQLGEAFFKTQALVKAQQAYEQARKNDPEDAYTFVALARIAVNFGNFVSVPDLLDQALGYDLCCWRAAVKIAQQLRFIGNMADALTVMQTVYRHCPNIAEVVGEYGIALYAADHLDEAEQKIRHSLELKPGNMIGLSALGTILSCQGRFEEARVPLEAALRQDKSSPYIRYELINVLSVQLNYDKANLWAQNLLLEKTEYRRDFYASFLQLLANTCQHDFLQEQGGILKNLAQAPINTQSAGFLTALSVTESDGEIRQLMQIHRNWAEEYVGRTVPLPAILHDRSRRPLQVGILSSDLRAHSVAKFVSPLLFGLDPDRVQILCYSPYQGDEDPVESIVREQVSKHYRIGELNAHQMVMKIREDKVDVLLEMNGMTLHSRLPSLINRAAPVQIEWLGYPFTTGLKQMDYWLADRYLKPTNPDYLYEEILEMPGSWICFGIGDSQKTNFVPAFIKKGHITFGSFNNMYKYSPRTLDLWADVLRRVPDSRFLICRPGVSSLVFQANFNREMEQRGISAERFDFLDSHREGLRHEVCYDLIDISLDTTPLTGGTTTVDSLYMGVPVVSLVGPALHQRISYAVMQHVGCSELCAETPQSYIDIAVRLAQNPDHLKGYFYALRNMVSHSVLADPKAFSIGFQQVLDELTSRHGLRD